MSALGDSFDARRSDATLDAEQVELEELSARRFRVAAVLKNPALVSMPLAFLTGIVVSLLSPERRAEERFAEAERQILLGAPAAAPPPTPAAEPVPAER